MNYWIIDGQLSIAECLLRIIISGICGALIGFERSRRQKDAGVRTHIIVAMGAALFMIVSKYGFADIPLLDTMKVDASRIASNVVSGVSFLGAGVIFVRGGSINGLTTAAGIWTIAAVGMAIGSGLYVIGIVSAFIILAVQIMLHHWLPASENTMTHEIKITLEDTDGALKSLMKYMNEKYINVIETSVHRKSEGVIKIVLTVRIPKDTDVTDALNAVRKIPEIISVTM